MLCAKYIKTLCYIENIETSCPKCTIMCKIHKCYAQNVVLKMQRHYAETLCWMQKRYAKCGNIMVKTQKCYAQNAEILYAQNVETLCTKLIHKRYAQNSCSKCRNIMPKRVQNGSWYYIVLVITVHQFLSPLCSSSSTPKYITAEPPSRESMVWS